MTAAGVLSERRFTAFGGAGCDLLGVEIDDTAWDGVMTEVADFECRLSRFRDDSELSSLNAHPDERFAVSPLLAALLRAGIAACARSDGLVNVAVHDAVVAAGYDVSMDAVLSRAPAACVRVDPQPVATLTDVLEVGDGWARLRRGHRIDLGGVAKGWLADRLCERFDNCVINLGGDLAARGDGPGGAGWPIGLCDGSVVAVRDAGVATSGTTKRRWHGGHHIIDPRTGAPAATGIAEISVVADSALEAEVLAKSALILGGDAAPAWLGAHGALRWRAGEETAA